MLLYVRGVRLAKMTLVRFWKKTAFSVWLRFYKINSSFVFLVWFLLSWCHLSFAPLCYDAINDVLPCWISLTNCQLKWLRTRSAEIWHEEKYGDCCSYHVGRWMRQREKLSPNHQSLFSWRQNCRNIFFGFLNFDVDSVRLLASTVIWHFHSVPYTPIVCAMCCCSYLCFSKHFL